MSKTIRSLYLHDGRCDELEFEDSMDVIHSLIDCFTIDIITRYVEGERFSIVLDDEGLLRGKQANPPHAVSELYDNPYSLDNPSQEQLYGNILIVKSDEDGNLASLSELDVEILKRNIRDGKVGWKMLMGYTFR